MFRSHSSAVANREALTGRRSLVGAGGDVGQPAAGRRMVRLEAIATLTIRPAARSGLPRPEATRQVLAPQGSSQRHYRHLIGRFQDAERMTCRWRTSSSMNAQTPSPPATPPPGCAGPGRRCRCRRSAGDQQPGQRRQRPVLATGLTSVFDGQFEDAQGVRCHLAAAPTTGRGRRPSLRCWHARW